jgi:small subunit ribosomal protein S16
MLVIRMQRTGRKGHAMFRVVIQDSRRTPTSGKVVAWLGSYDPHAKSFTVDKDKVAFYLEHGAQPSPRVAVLLKADGVKLPDWVEIKTEGKRSVRNPEKRRSTRPAEEVAPAAEEETPSEEAPAETAEPEAPAAEAEVPASEEVVETTEETPEAEAPSEAPAEKEEAAEEASES